MLMSGHQPSEQHSIIFHLQSFCAELRQAREAVDPGVDPEQWRREIIENMPTLWEGYAAQFPEELAEDVRQCAPFMFMPLSKKDSKPELLFKIVSLSLIPCMLNEGRADMRFFENIRILEKEGRRCAFMTPENFEYKKPPLLEVYAHEDLYSAMQKAVKPAAWKKLEKIWYYKKNNSEKYVFIEEKARENVVVFLSKLTSQFQGEFRHWLASDPKIEDFIRKLGIQPATLISSVLELYTCLFSPRQEDREMITPMQHALFSTLTPITTQLFDISKELESESITPSSLSFPQQLDAFCNEVQKKLSVSLTGAINKAEGMYCLGKARGSFIQEVNTIAKSVESVDSNYPIRLPENIFEPDAYSIPGDIFEDLKRTSWSKGRPIGSEFFTYAQSDDAGPQYLPAHWTENEAAQQALWTYILKKNASFLREISDQENSHELKVAASYRLLNAVISDARFQNILWENKVKLPGQDSINNILHILKKEAIFSEENIQKMLGQKVSIKKIIQVFHDVIVLMNSAEENIPALWQEYKKKLPKEFQKIAENAGALIFVTLPPGYNQQDLFNASSRVQMAQLSINLNEDFTTRLFERPGLIKNSNGSITVTFLPKILQKNSDTALYDLLKTAPVPRDWENLKKIFPSQKNRQGFYSIQEKDVRLRTAVFLSKLTRQFEKDFFAWVEEDKEILNNIKDLDISRLRIKNLLYYKKAVYFQ